MVSVHCCHSGQQPPLLHPPRSPYPSSNVFQCSLLLGFHPGLSGQYSSFLPTSSFHPPSSLSFHFLDSKIKSSTFNIVPDVYKNVPRKMQMDNDRWLGSLSQPRRLVILHAILEEARFKTWKITKNSATLLTQIIPAG